MKKHIVAFTAIVISCIIGASISGSSAANGIAQSNKTYAMADITSSDVSSAVSSDASSAVSSSAVTPDVSSTVSSDVSSAPSSTPSEPDVSSTPNSTPSAPVINSTVDNTVARNAALQAENDRHTQALDSINNNYDPQIAASKTLTQGYVDGGAKNYSQDDMSNQQNACDVAYSQWQYDNKTFSESMQYVTDNAWTNYNQNMDILNKMQSQKATYNKMVQEQNNLTALQDQKQSTIDSENLYHASRTTAVYTQYP